MLENLFTIEEVKTIKTALQLLKTDALMRAKNTNGQVFMNASKEAKNAQKLLDKFK